MQSIFHRAALPALFPMTLRRKFAIAIGLTGLLVILTLLAVAFTKHGGIMPTS